MRQTEKDWGKADKPRKNKTNQKKTGRTEKERDNAMDIEQTKSERSAQTEKDRVNTRNNGTK